MNGGDQNKWGLTDVVEGIITASDWNESGKIIAIQLLSFDDDVYAICNGQPYFNLIKQSVRLKGRIKYDRFGKKRIEIDSCELLNPSQF